MSQCKALPNAFIYARSSPSLDYYCPLPTLEGSIAAPSLVDVARDLYLQHTCHAARPWVEATAFVSATFIVARPLLHCPGCRRVHAACTTVLLATFVAIASATPGTLSVEAGVWFLNTYRCADVFVTIILAMFAGPCDDHPLMTYMHGIDITNGFKLSTLGVVQAYGIVGLSIMFGSHEEPMMAACNETATYGTGGYPAHLLLRWFALHPWVAQSKSRILREMLRVADDPCRATYFAYGTIVLFTIGILILFGRLKLPLSSYIVLAVNIATKGSSHMCRSLGWLDWGKCVGFGMGCMMPFVIAAYLIPLPSI
ncbi:hypothetical protein EXIGLDRAFT_769510 [Exidia glandulosa HHB12029]|uniref:Uncharacterized protein n=1 Tax=Exidia glandulosa HHB12029 TaxID=1314781 RepID=A0A165HGA5_EXIGL|nr:hypothetical protein EXIGLDRAFT_769510 [Exidia glandulosa HHB12029]